MGVQTTMIRTVQRTFGHNPRGISEGTRTGSAQRHPVNLLYPPRILRKRCPLRFLRKRYPLQLLRKRYPLRICKKLYRLTQREGTLLRKSQFLPLSR
jgi:hypothetical protein